MTSVKVTVTDPSIYGPATIDSPGLGTDAYIEVPIGNPVLGSGVVLRFTNLDDIDTVVAGLIETAATFQKGTHSNPDGSRSIRTYRTDCGHSLCFDDHGHSDGCLFEGDEDRAPEAFR